MFVRAAAAAPLICFYMSRGCFVCCPLVTVLFFSMKAKQKSNLGLRLYIKYPQNTPMADCFRLDPFNLNPYNRMCDL